VQKKQNTNITLLAWFNFFTDFKLYAPVAIIYFSQTTGSYALGMSVFSAVMLSAALFEVPTGVFSDRIGRKKTIVLGAAASVLAVTLYAIGQNLAILILGAMWEGLSRSFYSGNNEALLYDTLTATSLEAEYHTFLGKTSSMFQIALALSAVLGGVIANFSFALVMWFSVVPQLVCLLLSFKIIEPEIKTRQAKPTSNVFAHIREAIKYFIHKPKLRLLSLASILSYALGEAAFQFLAAFFVLLWPLWALGFSKVLANISAAISYFFAGRLIKKFTEAKILFMRNAFGQAVCFVAYLFPTVFSPLIISSTSLLYGVGEVANSNLMQKEFSQKQRATMGSLNSLAGSVLFAIVSFLLGLFADRLGVIKALLLIELATLSVTCLYWKLYRWHSQSAKKTLSFT
jgi:MFS family permease